MSTGASLLGRRASIIDVAERAGVSRQTVTRAMNDMPGISAATKQRVLDAARELQYRPSRFGRGLVSRGTPTLGLVVVDLTNGFWAELASAVLDEATERGWTVLIAETSHDARSAVATLLDHVDALFGLVDVPETELDELVGPTPIVLLDPKPDLRRRAWVRLDFESAMADAASHLVSKGRRRIVMLDWSRSQPRSERATSFVHAVESLGLDQLVLRHTATSEPSIDLGRLAAEEALAQWPDLDAFVCFNDPIAVGALKACQAAGRSVPADVSIIGVDGSAVGLVVTPELTTLSFDFRELARTAFSTLLASVEGSLADGGPAAHRPVRPQLVVRGSS
ncbi:LacI family DNA-binding transcriptional regulator [Agromyces sp. GXS1127]|uniref:LacI family DNA-binding transcriptional regulator n=1 Tax=Agromyces sp. GXS1127 TaxID=3424181 RepID=UPI003D31DBBD